MILVVRRSGVSRVCGEKVAAAITEKLGTHTHTHDNYHTLAANAYVKVITVVTSLPFRLLLIRPIKLRPILTCTVSLSVHQVPVPNSLNCLSHSNSLAPLYWRRRIEEIKIYSCSITMHLYIYYCNK